jgi:hypothetical protein
MTNRLQLDSGGLPGSLNRRIAFAGIVIIALLGLYLRYRCLGCLGFRWDEDLTALAVKALLEKGKPELPGGMVYLRFYPYQWLIAGSVKVFGFSEFSMRLPAVVFGTILIPAAYWVTAKLFDRPFGLIVAACIALSFWQVEMARTARMYTPFFVAYIAAAYAIYRIHYEDLDRNFSPWVPLLAVVALTIHQLAYSLSILLLLAIPLRFSLLRTISLVLQAGAIGIAFIAVNFAQQRYFYLPKRAAEATVGSQQSGDGGGPLAALLQQVTFPDITLGALIYDSLPIVALAALGAVFVVSLFGFRVVWGRGILYRALTAIAISFALLHQFNLVGLTLVTMLIALRSGVRGLRDPAWYRPAFLCFVIFLLWLAVIGILSTTSPSGGMLTDQHPRQLWRALFDYPNFRLFWSYVLERPLLALPLALGTMWGINKVARNQPDPTALFLIGGFWLVLFANGALKTKFEFFRYNLHLDPLFLMLCTVGIFSLPYLMEELGMPRSDRLNAYLTKPSGALTVAILFIVGVNPVGAVLTSARDYKETDFPYAVLGLDEYTDFKTPAGFVRDDLKDDDIIMVLDPREYWNYIGRVDYWIRSTNYESQTYQDRGRARDLYLGIPVIHNVDEVKSILDDRAGRTVWILLSKTHLDRTSSISDDLKEYLNSLGDRIVYVGRDGQTVVIRITD